MSSGPSSTPRVPSVDAPLDFLVFLDGNKVAHYTDDPLAAIHRAAKAKAHNSEQDVAIVVLTREEAELSDAEIRVRPFYPAPGLVAEEAVIASKQSREISVAASLPAPTRRSVHA
jgi:hypothetical protein